MTFEGPARLGSGERKSPACHVHAHITWKLLKKSANILLWFCQAFSQFILRVSVGSREYWIGVGLLSSILNEGGNGSPYVVNLHRGREKCSMKMSFEKKKRKQIDSELAYTNIEMNGRIYHFNKRNTFLQRSRTPNNPQW